VGSGLVLNLVHNPVGAFLPPKQEAIEAQFRRELAHRHGIVFNRLYTITNMPISRFLEFLIESGNYEGYMARLANAFNPTAAAGVMCRYTISVGWDGTLYDCDFNQMLGLPSLCTPCFRIEDTEPASH
jgi:radical SAM/Cys-rich protein